MRRSLAATVGIGAREVNVKFTTNEGMGAIGRGEGIAAMAVATVETQDQ
jgi:2C-methyl-D-erythritol 2,4-cyclodiphosphate synthase